jgi:hypothetical protein
MNKKPEPEAPRSAPQAYAIGIIVAHLALSVAHGMAHSHLHIGLNPLQNVFVWLVILAAPLAAGWFIWKRRMRLGGALLAISMGAALAFGVYCHYLLPGPDNVSQADPSAPSNWRSLFDQTAMDIALLEGLGVVAGVVLVLKTPRQEPRASADLS